MGSKDLLKKDAETGRALFERNLKTLQDEIGYHFERKELLREALQHTSYVQENARARSYERLEFLGDRVLELCVSEALFDRWPEKNEGELTKERAWIVNKRNLAKIGEEMGLNRMVRLGSSMENKGPSASIMADVLEAVVGAIYLDRGLDLAKKFVYSSVLKKGDIGKPPPHFHSRNQLQEKCRKLGLPDPRFEHEAMGPEHERTFTCVATLGKIVVAGRGRTKKEAEKDASGQVLRQLESTERQSDC